MRYSIPRYVKNNAQLGVNTTNRVLRNTYLLLAITLLPTIVGVIVGALFPVFAVTGWLGLILFFGAIFGLQYMIIRNRDSVAGIGWLLLFTFVMGYFLGPLIGFISGSYTNGLQLILFSVGSTATLFFILAGYASVTKRDFSSISIYKMLYIGMIMLFVISILNIFLKIGVIGLAVSSLFIVVACGFILFTVNNIVRGGETNYIVATMTIYIMLINLFQSILHLVSVFAGQRE